MSYAEHEHLRGVILNHAAKVQRKKESLVTQIAVELSQKEEDYYQLVMPLRAFDSFTR